MKELQVSPELRSSRRERLMRSPLARWIGKQLVRYHHSFLGSVTGSYAGIVSLEMDGYTFRYALGPNDPIGDTLYWLGPDRWEPEVTSIIASLASEMEGAFLDIGAHRGIYTLLVCAANPNAKAIAWEPIPFPELAMNIEINNLSERVTIRKACTGEQNGSARFYQQADPTMGGLSNKNGNSDSFLVSVERVDDVVGEKVGLIKIDVEGHEPESFRGMLRILREDQPHVVFESLNADHWLRCHAILEQTHDLYALSPTGPIKAVRHTGQVTNYLAVPRT